MLGFVALLAGNKKDLSDRLEALLKGTLRPLHASGVSDGSIALGHAFHDEASLYFLSV